MGIEPWWKKVTAHSHTASLLKVRTSGCNQAISLHLLLGWNSNVNDLSNFLKGMALKESPVYSVCSGRLKIKRYIIVKNNKKISIFHWVSPLKVYFNLHGPEIYFNCIMCFLQQLATCVSDSGVSVKAIW